MDIDKPDGGTRQLGIPSVIDRVIQQAIAQVLTPVFDSGFSDNSVGFRPGRNGQQAVKQVQGIIKAGRIQWHPLTLQKFKQQVRRLTNRNWGVSMRYQLFKISQFLRGWIKLHHFG